MSDLDSGPYSDKSPASVEDGGTFFPIIILKNDLGGQNS